MHSISNHVRRTALKLRFLHAFVVKTAIKGNEKLEENILAEGDFYEGDLLKSVVTSDRSFWQNEKESWSKINKLLQQNEALLKTSDKTKMKIGIFQDIHGNLPAFKKAMEVFNQHNCTHIYHVGDLISIGPHSREVFHLAISIPNLKFVMGNHDYWFAYGLAHPQPAWMNDEELEHQKWVHQQIGEDYRSIVQNWKWVEELKIANNRNISFLHYGYDPKTNWFKTYVKTPNRENIDDLFKDVTADMIFYGHNHFSSDISGNSRYVNLGSAGCYTKSEVRLGILEVSDKELHLEKYSVYYDDDGLMDDFELRDVPARKFITTNFLTRNED